MATVQEYRDALGTALGLITKYGLGVALARDFPEDMARLEAARKVRCEAPAADASGTMLAALRAIQARVACLFDHPDLASYGLINGTLGSADRDISHIAASAIAAAEGRETTDAPKVEPAPVDFEQRRDGWLVAFVPISSAARQWSIDAQPKGARWEHERWYAQKNRAPAVRHAIEAEGFTVREA